MAIAANLGDSQLEGLFVELSRDTTMVRSMVVSRSRHYVFSICSVA